MDKSINERVRMYRKRCPLTQNEMAERLGMKGSTYSQMEREGNIPAYRLMQIANVLGIEPYLLFEGEKTIIHKPDPIIIPSTPPEPPTPHELPTPPEPDPLEILSHKERNILKIFRFLPQEKKNKLYKYIMELEKE